MRKVYLFGLVGFIICFWGLTQVFADNLCVNTTGAHGCYTTIQDAVDNANAGDVIWVEPGVYYENVHVTTANLTIQGGTYARKRSLFGGANGATGWTPANPEQVIIDARPDAACACTGPGVWIDGVDNVTLRNLTVRHACYPATPPPDSGDNIWSTGDYTTLDTVYSLSSDADGVYIEGDYATIMNCYFTANDDYAVDIEGDYATVQDNIMYNQGDGCVYIDGDDALVTRNTIDGVEDEDAIYIGYGDNAVITYNTIRGVDGYGVEIYDGDYAMVANNEISSCYNEGIYLDYCDYSTVSNNTIHGIYDCGIEVYYDSSGYNTITNNTVYDLYGEGIYVDDLYTTITGNTVYNIYDYEGIYVYCDGGTISNNTVRGATDDYEGFYLDVDNMTISNNLAEYNANEGFDISGDNNTIQNNTARHNGHEWEGGFNINGDGNTVSNNLAELNPGYGFDIWGQNTVNNNIARNNYRTGIYLSSANGGTLTVNANTVTNNHGEGIANFAGGGGGETVNITNNTATGNRCDICNEGTITTFTGNTFNTGGDATVCCLE